MYKCLKSDFYKLKRKINKLASKLDEQDINYKFEILGETIEYVKVVDLADPSKPIVNNVLADVVLYNFNLEEIKLGNYKTIAILEHNRIKDSDENIVHQVDKSLPLDDKYKLIDSKCDHCNTNRRRNTTVLLKDINDTDSLIQVGLTCLKDYTRTSIYDVIKNYMDINTIFINEVYISSTSKQSWPKYITTLSYLAHSIALVEMKGYKKNVTRIEAWDAAYNNGLENLDQYYIDKALETIDFFKGRDFESENSDFMQNIKLALQKEYTKISGLVAYAYTAYKKQKEYDVENNEAARLNGLSTYIGAIGDKLEIEVYFANRFIFSTNYGVQQLYIFKDEYNNIYKWRTSKYLVDDKGESIEFYKGIIKMKGTVKAHEEYRGAKQTELARCRLINL